MSYLGSLVESSDVNGVLGTPVKAVGNGTSGSLTALPKGTASGPASLASVGFLQVEIAGATYFIPLFQ